MKLGFLTVPFADWSLEQVARWAEANGFDALEVACWPAATGDARRYAGVRSGAGQVGPLLLRLYAVGYDGPVVVEHEDRRFEGSEELVIRGFHLARDVLRPYVT